jgi:hypothetical protein
VVASTLSIQPNPSAQAEYRAELESTMRSLRSLVRRAEPECVSGDTARVLVKLFAEAERAASSGVALFAPVVQDTGSYTKEGHGSAQAWLGALTGSSDGVARDRLRSASKAAHDPALNGALHAGALSPAQLSLVAKAGSADPGAPDRLLGMAAQGASHQELSDEAARLQAAARSRESQRKRRERVLQGRHFRWHQSPDGGIRGEFLCDEVAWARVARLLEREAKERWKAAGSGADTPLEAHRLDAFLDLLARSGGAGGSSGAGSDAGGGTRPHTVIVIDAEALRRGTTQDDELCEIDGIGPVSVAAATELIGEGGLQYLVKEGFDVRTVTKTTRVVAQCIDIALLVRDRTCCVPGCGKRHGLERDHLTEFSAEGATELGNLARLCPEHHHLKSHGGWRLEGRPGHWRWVAPDHPKSAGAVARVKKVTMARVAGRKQNGGAGPGAGAGAAQRNGPMRD